MSSGQNIYMIKAARQGQTRELDDWVLSFHQFLELLLTKLSGAQIHIQILEVEEFNIESIYAQDAILIPIVSKELLKSSNFNEEIKRFHEKAINKGENNISWNSRIFKILRTPQKGHYLLDYLSDASNYNFFHIDPATDELVSYDDFTGSDSEKTFWMRLYDLAYDICKIIDQYKSVENELNTITKSLNSITIYLAEVGKDLIVQRDTIKRELLRNGYKVLPEKNMPDDLDSIMKLVKQDVSISNMSIHLVGSDYGNIKGTNSSIIDLQNRLAADYFNSADQLGNGPSLNIGRVLWIYPGISGISVKQRLYIENLKKDAESIQNADLLETTVEELKAFVINKINNKLDLYKRLNSQGTEEGKVIYLIYDKSEKNKCESIKKYLIENGYSVITSDFKGDPDEIRERHNFNLRQCDATLIYYGNNNQDWVRSKQKDLMKSLGLGREKPISPRAILIENESQLDESLGIDKKALILQNKKRFTPKVIAPFLAQLEK